MTGGVTEAPVVLEPVRRRHHAELARFLAAFPGETRSVEFWLHRFLFWWEANPACSRQHAAGWMLRREGRIVGFLGNVPLLFQAWHRPLVAFAGTTWRVLPEFRRYSVRLLSELIRSSERSLLFATTVGRFTLPILEGSKSRLLPRPSRCRGLRILEVSDGERLELRRLLADRGLVAAPAPPAEAGAFASDVGADVRELETAGREVDRLWRRTRSRWAFTNQRTADAVGWYCFRDPYHKKTLLGIYDRGELRGFLVSAIERKAKLELWNVLDVWLDPERPELLGAALEAVSSRASEAGCHAVRLPPLPEDLARRLAAHGFSLYRETLRTDFVKLGRLFPGDIPPEEAYFTDAQGDVGL